MTKTRRYLAAGLLAMSILVVGSACNSPTAPRFPQPEKEEDPKEEQGSVRGKVAMTVFETFSLRV